MIQMFTKESKTYEADELAAHARWSYYVSSFSMLDRTEGVPPGKIQFPFLRRNLPAKLETDEEYAEAYSPASNQDGLVIRISPNSYHMLYDPGTADWWLHSVKQQKRGLGAYAETKKSRTAGLKALTEDKSKNLWMSGLSDEAIDQINQNFEIWMKEGPPDVRKSKEATNPSAANTNVIAMDTAPTGNNNEVSSSAPIAAENSADQVMAGT